MKTIGLLSDTHSNLHPKMLEFFNNVDEIWHAGDIGNTNIIDQLESIAKLRAVYGNIDDQKVRSCFNEVLEFKCENLDVLLIHIGGYPGKYTKQVKEILAKKPFDLFISGHSHILKVIYDKKHEMMHLNPGAAGQAGFHQKRTALKFKVDGKEVKDLQIFEISR